MPPNRRYTDEEMRALIQRATELQAAAGRTDDHDLSLQEIETIAADLGLDPKHLHAAVRELNHRAPSPLAPRFSLFGGPFRTMHERFVPGPLTETAWEDMLAQTRQATGSTGRVRESGQTREWIHALDEGLGSLRLTARPHEDGTLIHLGRRYHGRATLVYLLTAVFSFLVPEFLFEGLGLSASATFALGMTFVFSLLLLARFSLGAWAKRQDETLGALADRLQETVQAQALARPVAPVAATPATRLDLPDLEEKSPQRRAPATRTRS